MANVIVERSSDTAAVMNVSAGAGGGSQGGISLAPPAPAPKPLTKPRPPPPPAPRPSPVSQPRMPAREMQDAFSGLANPAKLRARKAYGDYLETLFRLNGEARAADIAAEVLALGGQYEVVASYV